MIIPKQSTPTVMVAHSLPHVWKDALILSKSKFFNVHFVHFHNLLLNGEN